ncbi:MAG: type II toxin-antitoxin system VapC family toxin [Alphaproteobacteria bacterium]|nr:type II toxin-antitoxin system VapC family toxin [Alphaproteobacteria bacterium]
MAWILPTQATPAAAALLDQSNDLIFEAPDIFAWEVRNVLLALDRRGVLAAGEYDEALAIYHDLVVRLSPPVFELDRLAVLARAARLSLFDAAYFALALDRGWPLASRDAALLSAARAAGVECFDLR